MLRQYSMCDLLFISRPQTPWEQHYITGLSLLCRQYMCLFICQHHSLKCRGLDRKLNQRKIIWCKLSWCQTWLFNLIFTAGQGSYRLNRLCDKLHHKTFELSHYHSEYCTFDKCSALRAQKMSWYRCCASWSLGSLLF